MADTVAVPFAAPSSRKRGLPFWCILIALCTTLFLSALELTAVSTALPTIVQALGGGDDFVWIGSGYALASTAIIPLTGGLAEIFGRRPTTIASIILFAIGSAVCGAANSMNMIIGGRVIQGMGGGGALSLSNIVLADLVSLQERGAYGSLFGLTWSLASAVGPVVGGSLASAGQWRWLFYLNLPICAIAIFLTFTFLKLPSPPGTLSEKLAKMDWIGNLIIIGASISTAIGLTWGGVRYSWTSVQILAPLVLGVTGVGAFIAYDALLARNPIVPFAILSNRESLSGYIQTFMLPVVSLALVYYIPVYYQGCKDASSIHSGVLMLGVGALAPAAAFSGISVKKSGRYRPQIWVGWAFVVLGISLLSTVKESTGTGIVVGYTIITGIGLGMNYSTQPFPIQSPLPVTANAPALAFFAFVRSYAGVWGVTLGGAVLQNTLLRRLPPSFVDEFPGGVAIAYAAIPSIPNLEQPLKDEVHVAFADSLQLVWHVLIGVAGAGLLASLAMKGLPLPSLTDEKWAMRDTPKITNESLDLEKSESQTMQSMS